MTPSNVLCIFKDVCYTERGILYIFSIRQFIKIFKTPIYNFSGQFDLICQLSGDPDGQYTLIDWKTAQSAQKTWPLQIAAYRYLADTIGGIKTTRGMVVRLKRDGSGVILSEYPTSYHGHFSIFLGILNAHNFIAPKSIDWEDI